jgi:hypothetical protein
VDGAYVDFDILSNDDWRLTNVGPRNTARIVFDDSRPVHAVEGGGMPLQGRNPEFVNVRAELRRAAARQPWYRRWWGGAVRLWNS